MNAADLGQVNEYLLKWREVYSSPISRSFRENEQHVASILENLSIEDRDYLEDFYNIQGLSLVFRDGSADFGIPAIVNRKNYIFILIRKRGEQLGMFINDRSYLEDMKVTSTVSRNDIVFWTARLWLTLQWFFYEKIDRTPAQVSEFKRAIVTKQWLIDEVKQSLEKMGNQGRPADEAGLIYDYFWRYSAPVKIATWVGRFLKLMEEGRAIVSTGNTDEWRQSIQAAEEMAQTAIYELTGMLPPTVQVDTVHIASLLLGEQVGELPVVSNELSDDLFSNQDMESIGE